MPGGSAAGGSRSANGRALVVTTTASASMCSPPASRTPRARPDPRMRAIAGALGARPADRVAEQVQAQRQRAADRVVGREVGVRGRSRQPRRRALVAEQLEPERAGGHERGACEAQRIRAQPHGQVQRGRQRGERQQQSVGERAPLAQQRRDEASPCGARAARCGLERRRGRVHIALERDRAAVRERVRHDGLRGDPVELDPRRRERGRRARQGEERRADVVAEAGQRPVGARRRAAHGRSLLDNGHVDSGQREQHRADEPVVSGADYDSPRSHRPRRRHVAAVQTPRAPRVSG